MTDSSISLRGVSKRYWKIQERSLVRSLVPVGGPNRTTLRALHDINLEVQRGETIGVIGRNGAGKSTLLRLLAGVSQPSAGTVEIRGRIAPLLSVGVGFHHEMTGRENVVVNGMLLGLSKRQIGMKLDEIVNFAEVADFIDTPVKFYSSGMLMRLGFSVAAHADPDVLLVDEVLAVGDMGFQQRCYDHMRKLQASGTTIVFVSHWMHVIHQLCPRVVCLHRGRMEYDGSPEAAIANFHNLLATPDAKDDDAPLSVIGRELVRSSGEPTVEIDQDTALVYRVQLRFERPVQSPQFFFRVIAEDSTLAYMAGTTAGDRWRAFDAGEVATVAVQFRPAFGGGGTFHIGMFVTDDDVRGVLFHDQNGPTFYVPPRLGTFGVADLGATITVDGETRTNHRSIRLEHPSLRAESG